LFKQPGTTTKLKDQEPITIWKAGTTNLKKRISIAHPTIYKIIDEFKKEQAVNEVKMEQISMVDTSAKRQRDTMKLTKD